MLQSKTIQELTSGYRINSSGDDAAGLSVANRYRSDVAELTQGVRNASDGISQLQIVDGGISNISRLLDRMKTLATQSASTTFTGERSTLDEEFQQLVGEITRQASNIGLNSGGVHNSDMNVYIGGAGGNSVGTSLVNVNLSGGANAVDAASLGLAGISVLGGGSSFTSNNVSNLNDSAARFNIGASGAQTFAVSYASASGDVATANVSITGTAGGVSGSDFVKAVNQSLAAHGVTGVTAGIGQDGDLEFYGASLLSVAAGTSGTAPTSLAVQSGATLLNGANYQATGTLVPLVDGSGGALTTETLSLSVGGTNYTINLDSSTSGNTSASSAANLVASLNSQLKGSGVYATNVGNSVTLQGASAFTLAETDYSAGAVGGDAGSLLNTVGGASVSGIAGETVYVPFTAFTGSTSEDLTLVVNGTATYHYTLNSTNADTAANAADAIGNTDIAVWDNGDGTLGFSNTSWPWTLTEDSYTAGAGTPGSGSLFGTTPGSVAVTPPDISASATGNARNAITSINSAVAALGLVQGVVGTGENKLGYAVALAQSQITNFSAAESRIRDADVAAEAAMLTKAQILQQSSIAAMAQANSATQAVMRLLQ